ncbi:MAG TPA: formimidoylglutamate deiminase [Tepidisphaeraceae bacterium]|nr:formimidoylglutamate deiminase [Tepidisphaeraceae bacterium]
MPQTFIHARRALLADGWARDVLIDIDGGIVRKISAKAQATSIPSDTEYVDVLMPGMSNVHSHAFQRGMAGLAERRGLPSENFWSWREVMYRFALSLEPDQVEAIALQVYVEMLEAGFTRVGEFHYLHHDRDGRPYSDVGELAARIASASSETGIGLTLLPVFYAHSTFGGAPPVDGQKRFICNVDQFAKLVERSREIIKPLAHANFGIAPHSLRAVTPDELARVIQLSNNEPIHLHVSEQTKEVDDCLAWISARPMQWLLDHAPVNERWCAIHATHLNDDETNRFASTGAVAGLCPITEANLGDGIFNTDQFLDLEGSIGIGTDSNILIGVSDELRQLEYAQRLKHRARTVLARAGESTGRRLFEAAQAGGAQALNVESNAIRVGSPANFISLDANHPLLIARDEDNLLDAWIFAGAKAIDCVWVLGKKLVSNGRHIRRDEIARKFRADFDN